ncbi:hypothetical protein Pan189_12100 [Stratiformator vulcanicus]|uniref:Uncharacterized protein n=1 Tax=Stratiformator vulcanicus TaxID=2527980 RepID=A0A517QYW8_9PLAN|nr:hypothetical protein Pan189_12100 [Stratiformator vulcanicus]
MRERFASAETIDGGNECSVDVPVGFGDRDIGVQTGGLRLFKSRPELMPRAVGFSDEVPAMRRRQRCLQIEKLSPYRLPPSCAGNKLRSINRRIFLSAV